MATTSTIASATGRGIRHEVHHREREREQHIPVAHVAAPMEVQSRDAHSRRRDRADGHADFGGEQTAQHGHLDQHAHAHQDHERREDQRAVPPHERFDLVAGDDWMRMRRSTCRWRGRRCRRRAQ
jgi:hypothetical protein